jgi:hypothetical protein
MAYSLTGDSTYCAGQPGVAVGLNGSESDCYYTLYQNNVSVNTTNGTGFPLTFGVYPTGMYTVKGFKNPLGCEAPMTGILHVTTLPLPQAAGTINGPITVCQNTVMNYSIPAIAHASSYDWSIPTGATITLGQGTPAITVDFGPTSISGDVKVRGHNACGDGPYSSLLVTVNTVPSLTISASDIDICLGESVTLTANTNANNIVWSNGSTVNPMMVTPLGTTVYMVTATGINGCSITSSMLITVHSLPTVNLTLGQDHFCTDINSAILYGGSPSGGTYTASTGCIIIGNTIYPPVSFVGTYNVTYTYTDIITGCSTSATDLVTINPVPAVSFFSILGTIRTDTPPFDLNQYVSPTGGKFWGPGILADSSSMFYPDSAGSGTHMISYKYTHPITGCSASQIQYIPVGAVGINEIIAAVNAIEIFPNPADYQLNLRNINTKEISRIAIINIFGETVSVTDIVTEMMCIDISSYPSGGYFITFMNANGFTKGRMFMKR